MRKKMINKKIGSVLGIIAEYNPMHNGHIYHLQQAKAISRADFVVAIMSGSFCQRGTPAILDKWTRSAIALENGVDLVLELPCFYSCNSASYFARGAVHILESLGMVSHLSFGVESGSLKELQELADFFKTEPDIYQNLLKENLKKGWSFPRARSEAVSQLMGTEKGMLLTSPNNILAIAYLSYLDEMTPIPIVRKGIYHDASLDKAYPSATAVRVGCAQGKWEKIKEKVPRETYENLKAQTSHYPDEIREFQILMSILAEKKEHELKNIFSVTEGMEYKLKNVFRYSKNLDQLIENLKSKRYTRTGIRRMLSHILLNIEKVEDLLEQTYARVLGANEKGKYLLQQIKKQETASIPLITKVKSEQINLLLAYDIGATDLYNIITGRDLYKNCDFVKKPVV